MTEQRLSEQEPGGVVDDTLEDTGDYAEVPEEEQRDTDKVEANEDAGKENFDDVPDGEVVILDSAEGEEA